MTIIYRARSLTLLALGLLLVCSFASVALQAQKKEPPQKKAKELRIDEVTARDSSNGATAKQGFEFVIAGKNRVTVRSANADTTQEPPSIKGSYNCACSFEEKEGTCELQRTSPKRIVCKSVSCKTCILQVVVR